MDSSFIVNIGLLCYNQEKYIEQTIESLIGQKTSFPVEIIVADDCSTDGTRNILEKYAAKYPDLIRLLSKEPNKGLMGNYWRLMQASKGKYIACCAGDDYWHDPLKLEKQVTFLENNPDYGLVHTNANYYHESEDYLIENYKSKQSKTIPQGDVFEALFTGKFHISAITACFRKKLFDDYVDFENFIKMGFSYEDYPTWLELSRHTKFKYLDDSTATYRVIANSISRPSDISKKFEYVKMRYRIRRYYIDKFHLSDALSNEAEKIYHEQKFELAYKYLNSKEANDSFNFFKQKGYSNRKYSLKRFLINYPLLYRAVGRLNRLVKRKEAMLKWS